MPERMETGWRRKLNWDRIRDLQDSSLWRCGVCGETLEAARRPTCVNPALAACGLFRRRPRFSRAPPWGRLLVVAMREQLRPHLAIDLRLRTMQRGRIHKMPAGTPFEDSSLSIELSPILPRSAVASSSRQSNSNRDGSQTLRYHGRRRYRKSGRRPY